ncbi:MAG: hypothetical protein CBC55_09085 [Gammaproteobacteria bacterium TMED95]|nr:MAG: hypothetical protein CBC55_09085 [Gammaproteobacteria bacterium TMED95]|tara:strand:- start:5315 stop:6028 length:714 start_codon:yes stop_codon:yes gene_type:complete
MALPKLNETIKYSTKIPSSGETVRFRPYLVKEEKVLMIALEQGDELGSLEAICDTLESCIDEEVSVRNLPIFDIEYLFTQIRSKSVGESSDIKAKCTECDTSNDIKVDISKVDIKVPKGANAKKIKLSSDITLEMKYPTLKDIGPKMVKYKGSQTDQAFDMIAACISAVETKEERFSLEEETPEEVMNFIESFSTEQFMKVRDFIENMPRLKHDVKFQCGSCGHDNKLTLEGTADFF